MSEDTKRMERWSAQERAKSILRERFCANARRRPWALALAILLIAALCWVMTWVAIPFPGGSSQPLLTDLWNLSTKLAVILIAFLLVLAFFTSPPKKALEYESELAHIKFTDHYGNPPALVSRVHTNKIEKLTFYSAGISLERWKKRQGDIQSALNVTYWKEPETTHNSHYVLLTVVSGPGTPRDETLYDDEL